MMMIDPVELRAQAQEVSDRNAAIRREEQLAAQERKEKEKQESILQGVQRVMDSLEGRVKAAAAAGRFDVKFALGTSEWRGQYADVYKAIIAKLRTQIEELGFKVEESTDHTTEWHGDGAGPGPSHWAITVSWRDD